MSIKIEKSPYLAQQERHETGKVEDINEERKKIREKIHEVTENFSEEISDHAERRRKDTKGVERKTAGFSTENTYNIDSWVEEAIFESQGDEEKFKAIAAQTILPKIFQAKEEKEGYSYTTEEREWFERLVKKIVPKLPEIFN